MHASGISILACSSNSATEPMEGLNRRLNVVKAHLLNIVKLMHIYSRSVLITLERADVTTPLLESNVYVPDLHTDYINSRGEWITRALKLTSSWGTQSLSAAHAQISKRGGGDARSDPSVDRKAQGGGGLGIALPLEEQPIALQLLGCWLDFLFDS